MLNRVVSSRGDTIIEVMFAFVIFSLVVIGAFTLMNSGVATAQRSLEVTLVRQQIDGQIALVQSIQRTSPLLWKDIKDMTVDHIDEFGTETACPTANALINTGSFFVARTVDKNSLAVVKIQSAQDYAPAATYSMVDVMARTSATGIPSAYGLYARLARSDGWSPNNHSYDLHVRACWDSVGVTKPLTIGTVVRLFDAN